MSENACCAHTKVVSKITDNPNGTHSQYWECADNCGTKFLPKSYMDYELKRRVEAESIRWITVASFVGLACGIILMGIIAFIAGKI